MIQSWKNLFFLHFSIDKNYLESHLPDGLYLDTIEDKAFLAIVGFEMSRIFFPFLKSIHYPRFHELNLRTYIKLPNGKKGIYFFSLDANSRLGVLIARSFFKLPYNFYPLKYDYNDKLCIFKSYKDNRIESSFEFSVGSKKIKDRFTDFFLERYFFITYKNKTFYKGNISHVPYIAKPLHVQRYSSNIFERFNIDTKSVNYEKNMAYFCSGFDVKVLSFKKIPL